jgi:hypothetical protein
MSSPGLTGRVVWAKAAAASPIFVWRWFRRAHADDGTVRTLRFAHPTLTITHVTEATWHGATPPQKMPDTLPSSANPKGHWAARLIVRSEVIDLVIGSCLIGLAVAFWLGAAQFDEADASGVGAATFPRGIAVLLAVAAAMLVVRAVAALSGRIPSTITVTERPGPVVAGMALVILFPVLVTTLGYYIGSALWMPAFFVIAGYRKPLGIVVLTAGFLAFAKVAFEMTLGVRLP